MKAPARILIFFALCQLITSVTSLRSASAQNVVEQRIVLNWGVWNWDTYSIHGTFHLGANVPDGHYYLHMSERNGTNFFDASLYVVNGQPSPSTWVWSDFTYQARFVPDQGWTMTALSATGTSGPAQGVTVPASGEITVWRQDRYFSNGNVPAEVQWDFDLHVNVGGFPSPSPTTPPNYKCTDDKSGGNQESCQNCNNEGMARYSVHSMLVSLNIEDTPLRYTPPVGPAINFGVTYNQREDRQPAAFSYSNLGPKWTLSWLSYVTDNPVTQMSSTAVYVSGGGTETYSFDSTSQSFSPDPQSHALLVRTGANSYEKRFPDGSKQLFTLSNGAATYPRKLFMTQVIDPAGNTASVGYDNQHRITSITDALGRVTIVSYELPTDPLKITKVTDPFGRFALFDYQDGKLKTITDEIGIQSQFTYHLGTNTVETLTTPYGTTSFAIGENGSSRWIEITDPMGGKERVESRDDDPGIAASDPVAPTAPGIVNAGLNVANTFYWDKKAMAVAPGDYSKAKVKHWLYNQNGSISGIISSEKQPLENRVWYTYAGQPDYLHTGTSANPSQIARVLGDGTTQLYQYEYNSYGKKTRSVDPAGRSQTYIYGPNQIDLAEIRQTTGMSNELLGRFTHNSVHKILTEIDAAGQTTAFSYNGFGQILSRTNAKGEATTYAYGGSVPTGYLATITSPAFNGSAAVTRFGYDNFNRVRTVTNEEDQYTITTDYDNLDRKTRITYPDTTYEEFRYTDNRTGLMTLDLTGSRDRAGRWTYRHYDGNRKMDEITDPLSRTTRFDWCTCGSLRAMTDPNDNTTKFNRDLQGRIYQKVFADGNTIDYLFEGQKGPDTPGATGRLQSSTDALHRRTNFVYSIDDNLDEVTFTDSSGNPLDPPTPPVRYTYDSHYNRVTTMTDDTGVTSYSYYPIDSPATLGAGQLMNIDGPLSNDTVTFAYDELGRTVRRSIGAAVETLAYDSLGRLVATDNTLGHFERQYEKLTPRLRTTIYPNGQRTTSSYYGNDHDRRLQVLQSTSRSGVNLSKFDYAYDAEGQITSWGKLLQTSPASFWFDYDDGQQLVSARNASNPLFASERCDYGYDLAGNRLSDSSYDPNPPPGGGLNGAFTTYTANLLNQVVSRELQLSGSPQVRTELTYDAVGNLIDDGEETHFAWDAANRLIALDYPDKSRTEFSYDGLGRRAKIVEHDGAGVITSTKRFVWIGDALAQERDETNSIQRRYFAEGEERTEIRGARTPYYYTRDHIGSIREVTNKAGAIQSQYDYDPYGKRTRLSGPLEVDFGYAGYYHHARSGLDFALYRPYTPILGRWLTRDPIAERDGLNLYEFVGNNSINAVDPTGLFKIYGNWCGPDWTGGRSETYTPHASGYYRAPINPLDSACETHDICYYQCRENHPCDGEMRSECFRECDRALTSAANSHGGFWGRIIALAIDRPGKRNSEHNNPSCCQQTK